MALKLLRREDSDINQSLYESPFGKFIISADKDSIISVSLTKKEILDHENQVIIEAKKQLNAYFKKELTSFDLPLNFDASADSDFLKQVWTELKNIPFGKTISYLDLARKVATPKHTRAVGMANGKNPIPIIVPCHRVIGSNGSLTGFALGLEMKKQLLEHEMGEKIGVQASLF